MTDSFDLMATVTASTKRNPVSVAGVRATPTTEIASLSCLPLDPVDAEIRNRMELSTPTELLQTVARGGLDIKEGDRLVVGSTEYAIRAVEDWYWGPEDADFLLLILEEMKKA